MDWLPHSLFWEQKNVRDPLYGFISLSAQENRILETFAVQRLARIKQLAHTYIVYPGAVHTRLEHSLGSLNVAARICDQLSLKKREREIVRATALIHDIGQGPFSHPFEKVMRFVNGEDYSHEDVTKLMIEHYHPLKRALGSLRQDVLQTFDGDSLLSEVISSSVDSDKLDYLRRDSHHTGVAYGIFDFERIVRNLSKHHETDRDYIAIAEKAKDALESYRLARYSMQSQVYEHHARLIADDMFVRAVIISIKEGYLPKESLDVSNQEKFLPRYIELDDSSIEHYLLQNAKGIAKELIQDVRARKLLKRAYILPLRKDCVPNPIQRDKIATLKGDVAENTEKKIADEIGIDSGYVIVHPQSINIKLYERFEQTIGGKEKPILVLKRDGSVTSLEEVSPISASVNPIRRLFVFCPDRYAQEVKKIAEDIFKARSVY